MAEYRIDNNTTPWDMPHEIFWDLNGGANTRRAQWVLDNRPDVSLEELDRTMSLSDEELIALNPCGESCPVASVDNSLQARRWAFTPVEQPGSGIKPIEGVGISAKNIALSCLFSYRRGNCERSSEEFKSLRKGRIPWVE